MDEQALKAFLEDLTNLSKKHGLSIGACGCCGSPFIINEKDEAIADELYWVGDEYTVNS